MAEKTNIDYIMRSLLQKAVRRGDTDLTEKIVIYLLNNDDLEWLRKRLAAVTFEETWPYGLQVSYDRNAQTLINHYINIAKLVKNKEAAGLGSFAYELSTDSKSFLNVITKEDYKHIKIVSEAVKRPNDFWDWALKTTKDNHQKSTFIANSLDSFKKASWMWDKAFVIAAAYLAINNDIPKLIDSEIKIDCPYWVGIDKHTQTGKQAIRKAAQQLYIDPDKAGTISFYLEGAICNQLQDSYWWNKEFNWKMSMINLEINQAQEIWNKLKVKISAILAPESEIIGKALNNIKLDEKFDTKEQLGLF